MVLHPRKGGPGKALQAAELTVLRPTIFVNPESLTLLHYGRVVANARFYGLSETKGAASLRVTTGHYGKTRFFKFSPFENSLKNHESELGENLDRTHQ